MSHHHGNHPLTYRRRKMPVTKASILNTSPIETSTARILPSQSIGPTCNNTPNGNRVALESLAPDQAVRFRNNLSALQSRLSDLDRELADTFAALGNQPILFSHPVYQYLQRLFGLDISHIRVLLPDGIFYHHVYRIVFA